MKTERKTFLIKLSIGVFVFLIFCMLAARNIYHTLLPQVEVSPFSSGEMAYYLTKPALLDETNGIVTWQVPKSEGDAVQEKSLSVTASLTIQTYTGTYDVQTIPLTITSRTLSEDKTTYSYQAAYEAFDGTYVENTDVMTEMTWQSGQYDAVVPLGAVKEDQNGTYLNVVRTEKGLFSEVSTVVQLRVEVIAQNGVFAAISGGYEPTDLVIVDTDKTLTDGAEVKIAMG